MDRQNKLKDSTLQFFHDLFDLMVVNCLWLLCSLPVLTVGPATCGLYAVTLKMARGEAVNPLKDFWHGLRSNFKPSLVLGLIAILLPVISAVDAQYALQLTGAMRTVYLVVAIMIAVIWLIFIAYTFALQVMFENTVKVHLQNAFKLAVVAPGKTIGIWLILLLPIIIYLVLPPIAMKMLGFLYIVVGISAPVYWASHIQFKIFSRVNSAPAREQTPTAEE